MVQKDTLFDGKWTWLDGVKIAMLIVTMFSTWAIVDFITPDVPFAFVRELAAVVFVEGAFLAFEYATTEAKSKKQVKLATNGFFLSLAVIVLFALTSGALEFGGEVLLSQPAGTLMGLDMTAREWVMLSALTVLSVWIGGLGIVYRLYTLADPAKMAELEKIALNDIVTDEANKAMKSALDMAKPVIAIARAKAHVRSTYAGELSPVEMEKVVEGVESHLTEQYGLPIPLPSGLKGGNQPPLP